MARIRVLGVEACRTLLLERRRLLTLADEHRISIYGVHVDASEKDDHGTHS
jgi:DUF1009 family protein